MCSLKLHVLKIVWHCDFPSRSSGLVNRKTPYQAVFATMPEHLLKVVVTKTRWYLSSLSSAAHLIICSYFHPPCKK